VPPADRSPSGAQRPHVCVVGALPPPVHGMATVTAEMRDAIAAQAQVTVIDTSPRSLSRGVRYHLRRLLGVVRGLPLVVRARMLHARTLYMPLDEGMGGIWNLAFLILARLAGMRLFLHHHSFRYISGRTRLMAAIVAVAGRGACHIVLCPTMEARLRAAYPGIGTSFVAPNPVAAPLPAPPTQSGNPPTIGMLANLTFEKGVSTFIDLVEAMPGVHGILAGPAAPDVRDVLEAAVARLHPRLTWLGPVADGAKERFFCDIDVFVFPTRYRTEAYPLVLAEALTRGVAVVAPERGCIGALAVLDAVDVIGLEEDFVTAAMACLRSRFAGGHGVPAQRAAVRSEGEALNRTNAALRGQLVAAITATGATSGR
jgi:glycosyltransferase involved in cell wall biosynthesis